MQNSVNFVGVAKTVLGRFGPIKNQSKCNILLICSCTKYLHKGIYIQIRKTRKKNSSTLKNIKSLGKSQRNYFSYYKLAQNKPLEWDYVYRNTVNGYSLP